VVDGRVATRNRVGRWVAEARPGSPLGWAVRPDDLDATASRLGLETSAGSRTTPSGELVAWRTAGLDRAVVRPHLPFFIEWLDPTRFPGATASPAATVERIELECDAAELSAWLGEHSLPLDVRPGSAGITVVVLDGPRGRITLGGRPGL
jgi:Glyoxalase-like domain